MEALNHKKGVIMSFRTRKLFHLSVVFLFVFSFFNIFIVVPDSPVKAFCFVAGTQIATPDGYRNIEDIEVGDLVRTYNFSTHVFEYKPVVKTMSPFHDDIVEFQFSNGKSSRHTYDHPYFVVGKGWASFRPDWTYERYHIVTVDIQEGDTCIDLFGCEVTLDRIKVVDIGTVRTYNFFVKDNHNYFADGILVHNKGCNAPDISAFNLDTELGANSGWDLDNDDVQIDISFSDTGNLGSKIYFTYGKGSPPSDPTVLSHDAEMEPAFGDQSNYDLDWDNALGWSDYDGTIYVKARGYDSTDFGCYGFTFSDTLTGGIDGTDPSAPTYNTAESQTFTSNPTLDIDFSDGVALDDGSYKIDSGGAWNSIFTNDADTSYTTNWDLSDTWAGISEATHYIYFKVTDDAGNEYITPNDGAGFEFTKGSAGNNAPSQSSPSPSNGSSISSLSQLCINISDADGDNMNWSMWTNESGSWVMFDSDNEVGNGTNCSVNTSWVDCDGVYYWSVNLTDGEDWSNETYHFTYNNDPPWVHNPSHTGQVYETDFTWEIDINDNQSDLFGGSIECSTGDNTSGDDENNGTFSVDIHLSGCDETATIWVNVTDGCEATNETYSINYINEAPWVHNPSLDDAEIRYKDFIWCVDIDDNESDAFDWNITCSNGDSNSSADDTNDTFCLTINLTDNCSQTYYVWVNVTDGCNATNASYSFDFVQDCPWMHDNSSGPFGPGPFTWCVDIEDNESDLIEWTVEGPGASNSSTYSDFIGFEDDTSGNWTSNGVSSTLWEKTGDKSWKLTSGKVINRSIDATCASEIKINFYLKVDCDGDLLVQIRNNSGSSWITVDNIPDADDGDLEYSFLREDYTFSSTTEIQLKGDGYGIGTGYYIDDLWFYVYSSCNTTACIDLDPTGGHSYTIYVNATDGCCWTRQTYDIYVEPYDIIISPCPANDTMVCPCSNCMNTTVVCVYVEIINGEWMDISFWSNWSGTWIEDDGNQGVNNGTYCAFFPVEYNASYYWYVNVSESNNSVNYVVSDTYVLHTNSSVNCTCSIGETDIETLILDFIDTNGMYLIPLILFILFFCVGYLSDKRSAGAFLLVSGLLFLVFSILVFSIEPTISVLCVVTAIFISLIGINKWLIKPNLADESQRES